MHNTKETTPRKRKGWRVRDLIYLVIIIAVALGYLTGFARHRREAEERQRDIEIQIRLAKAASEEAFRRESSRNANRPQTNTNLNQERPDDAEAAIDSGP